MSRVGEISQALEVRDSGPEGMIEQYRAELMKVMPAHLKGDTWLRAARNALLRNKDLMSAARNDPGSLMNALAEAAELGHRPGSDSYYLVPLKGRVEGWEGYKGLIERMYRSGQVASVVAEVVYERDDFGYEPGPGAIPRHVPFEGDDPGKLVRVYAYAQMVSGAVSRVAVLRERDVERHRKMSKGHESLMSPWVRFPEKMWLKSAVKDLSAWVPLSVEWRQAPVASVAAPVPESDLDDEGPIDAELVD